MDEQPNPYREAIVPRSKCLIRSFLEIRRGTDRRETMDDGRWTIEDGRSKMDDGRRALDAGCSAVGEAVIRHSTVPRDEAVLCYRGDLSNATMGQPCKLLPPS